MPEHLTPEHLTLKHPTLKHRLQPSKWKPLKWWLFSLLALAVTLWLSGTPQPAWASSHEQGLFKVGGDLTVTNTQKVTDVFTIDGDLTIQDGTTVQGDAFALGGNLQLEENTLVEGDAFAIGGKIIRAESAVINGNEFTVLEQFSNIFERFGVFGTLYLTNLVFWIVGFVVAAIAGSILLLLLPSHVDAIATTLQQRPFASLLYGLGGLAALTILTVLTVGSALGSILIPFANLAVALTGLFGGTTICVWLGGRLQRQSPSAHFSHFWRGLILLFVISLVPIAGGLLVSFIIFFGFGAALLARYGTQPTKKLPSSVDASLERLEHQT